MIKGDDGRVLLDRSGEANYGTFKIPADSTGFRKGSPVDELLTLLVEGDSVVMVYELDSLERQNPSVKDLNSISYEIAIKEVLSQEEMDARNEEDNKKKEAAREVAKEKEAVVSVKVTEALSAYKTNALGDDLKSTESGMEYLLVKEGTGPVPKVGDLVDVHYYGVLESDGEMFDNSYQRGDYFNFPVGQGRVIKGWDEALQVMPKGSEGIFFIPFELAYGAAGRPPRIPEKAMLVFFIEYP